MNLLDLWAAQPREASQGGSQTFHDGRAGLHGCDCVEAMRSMAVDSVDSVVCDPPYGLQFMGRKWDAAENVAFRSETWAEVLRVLKPGGFLVAFGGSRTYHRLACAIEDAGFEIRDQIQYLYGTGFPKSLNVSEKLKRSLPADVQCVCAPCSTQKVQDSSNGCSNDYGLCDGQPLASASNDVDKLPLRDDALARNRDDLRGGVSDKVHEYTHFAQNDRLSSEGLLPREEPRSLNYLGVDNVLSGIALSTSSVELTVEHRTDLRIQCKSHLDDDSVFSREQLRLRYPHIPQCKQCGKLRVVRGLGSALKPAHEPIVLARKPLAEGTVAANVLAHGTGAINVDACRIESTDAQLAEKYASVQTAGARKNTVYGSDSRDRAGAVPHNLGRFPANLIHDGSPEVLAGFPQSKDGVAVQRNGGGQKIGGDGIYAGSAGLTRPDVGFGGAGSAARFFYCAKASKTDRAGSKHPTVKPVALMRWLVRLVTPPGGTVFDPFAGSGTTGQAALEEGFLTIMCEKEAEYQADIAERMRRVAPMKEEQA